jgi:hypothetical protein
MEEQIVTPLEARIAEVAQYEKNIILYQSIVDSLPSVWPDSLIKFRNARNQHETVKEVSNDDVELLSKLWYRDECLNSIKTETVEMIKAKAILKALQK